MQIESVLRLLKQTYNFPRQVRYERDTNYDDKQKYYDNFLNLPLLSTILTQKQLILQVFFQILQFFLPSILTRQIKLAVPQSKTVYTCARAGEYPHLNKSVKSGLNAFSGDFCTGRIESFFDSFIAPVDVINPVDHCSSVSSQSSQDQCRRCPQV